MITTGEITLNIWDSVHPSYLLNMLPYEDLTVEETIEYILENCEEEQKISNQCGFDKEDVTKILEKYLNEIRNYDFYRKYKNYGKNEAAEYRKESSTMFHWLPQHTLEGEIDDAIKNNIRGYDVEPTAYIAIIVVLYDTMCLQ